MSEWFKSCEEPLSVRCKTWSRKKGSKHIPGSIGTQLGLYSGGGGHGQSGMPTGHTHWACTSAIRQVRPKSQPPMQSGSGKGGAAKNCSYYCKQSQAIVYDNR